jgi:hypothetical protein
MAALLALATGTQAQDQTKKLDDFESDLTGWTAIKVDDNGFGGDEESKLTVTRDAQHVKTGKGALLYSYELTPTTARVLSLQRPKDFTGMKSLHFWVKCTSATALVVSLNETGGGGYQTGVYCPSGSWQEVAVNLDELVLDDPAKDGNGKLDLDEIETLNLMDMGSFLVKFLADIKGPRLMWLDDIVLSSKPVAQTTGVATSAKGAPVYLVDTFESPLIRWAPASFELSETPRVNLFDAPLAIDADAAPEGGKRSMKMTYTRQAAKIQGLIRDVEKVDLKKATGLELALKTSHDGTFIVSVKEKDESRYQAMFELKAADGWKKLSYPFTTLAKADDSTDENGKLDADQIKEVSIADVTTLLGGGAGAGVEAVLRVDEVRFTLGE